MRINKTKNKAYNLKRNFVDREAWGMMSNRWTILCYGRK